MSVPINLIMHNSLKVIFLLLRDHIGNAITNVTWPIQLHLHSCLDIYHTESESNSKQFVKRAARLIPAGNLNSWVLNA